MAFSIQWKLYKNIKDLVEIQSIEHLRHQVFTIEQSIPSHMQMDEKDLKATHVEMLVDSQPIGAARIFVENDKLFLGRFLILKEHRHLGLGRNLMDKVVEEARKTDFQVLTINAQQQVVQFYEKCGAIVTGEAFILADIPHVPMVYNLK